MIVLNYHNFSEYNNYRLKRGKTLKSGYGSNFNKQIRFLNKHFQFSYPNEFFGDKTTSGIHILITFDDGYKDNYDIAFPILKQHNAKVIFFIVTNIIGTNDWLTHDKLRFLVEKKYKSENEVETCLKKMNQGHSIATWIKQNENLIAIPEQRLMMNWKEVEEIDKEGFKIAPHTHQHSILSFLDYTKQEGEIQTSIKTLESKLKKICNYFAYPNGLYNADSLNVLNKSAIQYGFTTQPGFNSKENAPLQLKRIGVNASDSIGVLLLKLYLNRKK
ncbi:polysaccharide deacetylase family protein [Winogradskyella sediminis]|uniref:polysaccharide deacetylase family protein n=1 Tax=Winogradskyella sediminis TaxID=1382466 RepID=UPI0014762DE7|nr:polysaccharide deacetylase family protein [Winogradskyella sediminis]